MALGLGAWCAQRAWAGAVQGCPGRCARSPGGGLRKPSSHAAAGARQWVRVAGAAALLGLRSQDVVGQGLRRLRLRRQVGQLVQSDARRLHGLLELSQLPAASSSVGRAGLSRGAAVRHGGQAGEAHCSRHAPASGRPNRAPAHLSSATRAAKKACSCADSWGARYSATLAMDSASTGPRRLGGLGAKVGSWGRVGQPVGVLRGGQAVRGGAVSDAVAPLGDVAGRRTVEQPESDRSTSGCPSPLLPVAALHGCGGQT